jgi:hypothetical protein
MLTLLVLAAPWPVAKEVAHGRGRPDMDLKSAFRALLWIWNRSWVPFKFNLGSYFDIGWYLSETSCDALSRCNFLSGAALKHKCDQAQLKLSSIRLGVESGDSCKLSRVDGEVLVLVGSVFTDALKWATAAGKTSTRTDSVASPEIRGQGDQSRGFDNASTRSALLDFDDLCAKVGQEYFLVSGTFLGVVRDGAFIGHDHDIDVGVFEDALRSDLITELRSSDKFVALKLDRICRRIAGQDSVDYEYMDKPSIIKAIHRTGISIDIFVHFKDGEVIWHGSNIHRWNNANFGLANYEFLGRQFNGAENSALYLQENYGEDWRIPKVDFNVNFDTPNLSFAGTANALIYFAWVLANAVEENNPGMVRKYIDLLTLLGVIEVSEGTVMFSLPPAPDRP